MTDNDNPRDTLLARTPQTREVPLSDIYVDMRFQRALNLNAVARIKDEFHPLGVGHILLARISNGERSTGFSVIDGQTRVQALKELHAEIADGNRDPVADLPDTVTAEVFDEVTVPEAAVLFSLRNNQKPIPPKDRDRILVAEGDPIMREVVNQAANAGYRVFDDDDANVNMPHRVHAKRLIRWGQAKSRPKLLEEALNIQAQAFGTEVGYLNKDILQATGELLLRNPNLNEDELVRIMSTLGEPGVRGQAEVASAKYGQRMSKSVRGVLVDAYNKGKRGSDKIRI